MWVFPGAVAAPSEHDYRFHRPHSRFPIMRREGGASSARLHAPVMVEGDEPFTSLDTPLGSLIGREADVESVMERLTDPGTRLVTLWGPGGAGKTRLAREIGQRLADDLLDRRWFVDLGAVSGAEAVALVACRTIGLDDRHGPPHAAITRRLGNAPSFVVFDNCEHVVEAVAKLAADILRACPQAMIVATSRVRLRVRGECVLRVASLPVPDADVTDAGHLEAVASVALFVHHAQQTQAAFRLDETNAAAIATICRRLEGLPLALEFAAAHVVSLTPAEIEELLQTTKALPGRHRGGHHHQRTMEATVEWSHRLLEPAAQVLYRRCSVFVGSFTFASCRGVCADDELAVEQLSAALADLVDHSLIEVTTSGASSRYRLPGVVRQHAGMLLDRAGERPNIAAAHRVHFAALAAARDDGARHMSPLDVRRVMQEHENCLAAAHSAAVTRDARSLLALLGGLAEVWRIRGMLRFGVRELELLRAAMSDLPVLRSGITGHLADFDQQLGDGASAERRVREAFEVFEPLGSVWHLRIGHAILGEVALDRGDLATARRELDRAFALFDTDDGSIDRAFWCTRRGEVEFLAGDLTAAGHLFDEARRRFAAHGRIWYLSLVLGRLGRVARAQGDMESAFELLLGSLREALDYGAVVEAVAPMEDLAGLLFERGLPLRAAAVMSAADAFRERIGAPVPSARGGAVSADVQRIKASLGARRFGQIWARSRQLNLTDVIDLAIGSVGSEPSAATSAAESHAPLTRREHEVAVLVAEGLSNRQIGSRLSISGGTARIHVERILAKLGATSRVQIATWVLREEASAQ